MKVGVVLLLEGNDALGAPRYRQVRNLARQAEAAGFDSLWLYDHAWAGRRLKRGRVRGLRPAVRTAGSALRGSVADYRAVPLLRAGQADFAGSSYQANDCANLPRGLRPHGPPVLVGAFGPRMQRLVAQHADGLNGGGPDALRTACAAVGRDVATLALSTPLWVAFPDLGPIPAHMRESSFESAAGVAERMGALAAEGFGEIMIDLRPNTPAALERLVQSLAQYRSTA